MKKFWYKSEIMKYIFWNTHNNENINVYLQKLLEVYQPDFLGLAEYNADGKQLEDLLRRVGLDYNYIQKIGSRIDIFYSGSSQQIRHCSESEYYTIKILPYGRKKQILAVVHLPSKMYSEDSDNEEIIRELLSNINDLREIEKNRNVVLMGDFNMNPFDPPMIDATALQAISSREMVLRREKRNYRKRSREFYYNPMWNFLGDEKRPIGSYYYSAVQNRAMYWNTFDQFIVSKELIKDINIEKIKFISCIDNVSLENERGEPTISDHFPLYFELGEQK